MDTIKNADFFRQFNQAFFQGNQEFIRNNITEDVKWTMVGAETIRGKQAFLDTAFKVEEGYSNLEYSIDFLVTEDSKAVVKGKMKVKEPAGTSKLYAFCDLYVLSDEEESQIKEVTTFLMAIDK